MADISRRSAIGWFGALLLPWAPKKSHAVEWTRVVGEVIQGDVNCFGGHYIVWVDANYDEKSGAVIEPLFGDKRDLDWMRV